MPPRTRPADGERTLQPCELFSRNVGAYAEDGCPHDPTRYVEEQEAAPGHVVDARQERRDRSEKRQESSEEHHGAAVPREQVPSELQTAGIEPQVPAIPLQETTPVSLANPEADVVADDGSHTGGGHDETDVRGRGWFRRRQLPSQEWSHRGGEAPCSPDRQPWPRQRSRATRSMSRGDGEQYRSRVDRKH